jgi:hypothetical protein
VTLDDHVATTGPDVDVLDLDRALTRLATFDPRKTQIAELTFFGGLSLAERDRRSASRSQRSSVNGRPRVRGSTPR